MSTAQFFIALSPTSDGFTWTVRPWIASGDGSLQVSVDVAHEFDRYHTPVLHLQGTAAAVRAFGTAFVQAADEAAAAETTLRTEADAKADVAAAEADAAKQAAKQAEPVGEVA